MFAGLVGKSVRLLVPVQGPRFDGPPRLSFRLFMELELDLELELEHCPANLI
jgi:hypothetical protein